METLTLVLEKANEVMGNRVEVENIKFPALREVMEEVIFTAGTVNDYTRHSDHSKSSTRGCVMGCVGG
ncbi:MAG TPA: hypothetical protein DEG92_04230 [Rikenellaceae bacterium]|nr:hypothetical protein [Rikenellaceae bacterium]